MRTQLLRSLVAAAAVGTSATAIAGDGSPANPAWMDASRWDNFRPVSEQLDRTGDLVESLPSPVGGDGMGLSAPMQQPVPQPMPYSGSTGSYAAPQPMIEADSYAASAPCSGSTASPYASAMSAPWGGSGSCGVPRVAARPALSPWFAGGNVLFYELENSRGLRVFNDYRWDTSVADPGNSVGFDVSVGRYLGCGRYGLGVTYFQWDPSENHWFGTPGGGAPESIMAGYSDIYLNASGIFEDNEINADGSVGSDGLDDAAYSLRDHINGRAEFGTDGTDDGGPGAGVDDGGTNSAQSFEIRRDLDFRGIEVNLFSFGLMGANRVAYAGGSGCGGFGRGCNGYGGALGPLARPTGGRCRVITSHGFRWLQVEDSLQIAYDIDGEFGITGNDLYDQFNVENNLYGYQFGGRLIYCLTGGLALNIGGKVGVYGNDVEAHRYVGTTTTSAFATRNVGGNYETSEIPSEASDTALASIGELDLGLGYRLNNAWTVTGGYRLTGITGVATAVDSHPNQFGVDEFHLDTGGSYLLHGGYVGLAFNW